MLSSATSLNFVEDDGDAYALISPYGITSESVEKLLPLVGEDKGGGEDVDKLSLFTLPPIPP